MVLSAQTCDRDMHDAKLGPCSVIGMAGHVTRFQGQHILQHYNGEDGEDSEASEAEASMEDSN